MIVYLLSIKHIRKLKHFGDATDGHKVHIQSGCNQCRIVRPPRADTHDSLAAVVTMEGPRRPDAALRIYKSADGYTAYAVYLPCFLASSSFVRPKQ